MVKIHRVKTRKRIGRISLISNSSIVSLLGSYPLLSAEGRLSVVVIRVVLLLVVVGLQALYTWWTWRYRCCGSCATRRPPRSQGRMTGVLLVERKRGDNTRRQGGLAAKFGLGRRRRSVYEASKSFVSTIVDWVQMI